MFLALENQPNSRHGEFVNRLPVVGRDGSLYVMLEHADGNILLTVSQDGGKTFDTPRRVLQIESKSVPNNALAHFPRGHSWPALAIDSRTSPGRLYLVWKDDRYGDADILASFSDDGGQTWAAPVRVNTDPTSNGRHQIMPRAAVDPTDGTLNVIFYDYRSDPQNKHPTMILARSVDGGLTFANHAWSAERYNPEQASLGDYNGIDAYGGRMRLGPRMCRHRARPSWTSAFLLASRQSRSESRTFGRLQGPGSGEPLWTDGAEAPA